MVPGCVCSKSVRRYIFRLELREQLVGFKLVVEDVVRVTLDVEMRSVGGLEEDVGVG